MEPQYVGNGDKGMVPQPTPADEPQFAQEIAEIKKDIAGLAASVKQVNGMFEQMLGHIAKPAAEPAEDQSSAPPDPAQDLPPDEELEAMPRRQALELTVQQLLKAVEQRVMKPLNDKIDTLSQSIVEQRGMTMLEKAAAKYPDLHDWETELRPVLENMKRPDIDAAMVIVRNAHPNKAKELQAKYEKAPEPDEDDLLVSLVPTRPGVKAKPAEFGSLDINNAALAAFQRYGPDILSAQREAENQALAAS